MKIQTSELSGEALNYAVAKSFNIRVNIILSPISGNYLVQIFKSGMLCDYAQGGLDGWNIFDEHCTAYHRDPDGTCWATVGLSQCSGNDILEAFLRALVTERSGKEVDVPDELVKSKEGKDNG